MSFLPLFVDSNYQLRSGWKFVAYSALMVFLFVATGLMVGGVVYWINPTFAFVSRDIRFIALNVLVLFVPSILSLLIMARYVDRVLWPCLG